MSTQSIPTTRLEAVERMLAILANVTGPEDLKRKPDGPGCLIEQVFGFTFAGIANYSVVGDLFGNMPGGGAACIWSPNDAYLAGKITLAELVLAIEALA